MSKTKTEQLYERLFLELSLEEGDDSGMKKAEPADPDLNGQERESLTKKLPKLVAALDKLGIDKPKDRLCVCNGAYSLTGDKETHKADCDILLDLAKTGDLGEDGFIAIDAAFDGECHSITIISADTDADWDIPSADELYDVTQKESKLPDAAATAKMVEELVKQVVK